MYQWVMYTYICIYQRASELRDYAYKSTTAKDLYSQISIKSGPQAYQVTAVLVTVL